mmetsp:Transcript_8113/g.30122  ORF Transcript_8113/g.30122 Transcript_8113/m.30122 type:complete len:111 (+) Transcript_8113:1636-1968(+)
MTAWSAASLEKGSEQQANSCYGQNEILCQKKYVIDSLAATCECRDVCFASSRRRLCAPCIEVFHASRVTDEKTCLRFSVQLPAALHRAFNGTSLPIEAHRTRLSTRHSRE